MYVKSDADLDKLFQVRNFHIENTEVQKRWIAVAGELNEFFGVGLTPKQWKTQYENGINRMKKYGSPGIKLPRTKEKEMPNIFVAVQKTKFNIEDQKQKLKNYLTKPKLVEDIGKFLEVSNIEVLGIIQSLKLDGYLVMHNEYDNTFVIDKKPFVEVQSYIHSIGETREFEFVVISCSHWASKKQQKSFTEYIYDEAEKRNIKDVYHCGDIVDGYYKNRPEHIFELIPGLIGADEQAEYVINNWPRKEGITTHIILGNHDETHIKNGGFNIGKAIAKSRSDFKYLGIGYAKIELTPNCRMDIFHPLDGSSYAISYSGQKYMDSISGGDKPNILFVGHHHKALYFPYRNIHYFEVPSLMAQSSWMKRKRIANESGAWFVKLTVDEQGTIVRIIPEHIKQYKFLENNF